MSNAYRDELESLRARAEKLEEEARGREAELESLRASLAERDALFARLRTVVDGRPRRRVWPFFAGGAVAAAAIGMGALASPRTPPSIHPVVSGAAAAEALLAAQPAAPKRPEVQGPIPEVTSCGDSYVASLRDGGAVECLNGQSENAWRTSAEILEKPDGTPYLIVDGYEAGGRRIDIVGPVQRLPGESDELDVRVHEAGGSTRASISAHVRVTRFGAVGERVQGEALATMVPRLNEAPEQLHLVFSVVRAPDRRSP